MRPAKRPFEAGDASGHWCWTLEVRLTHGLAVPRILMGHLQRMKVFSLYKLDIRTTYPLTRRRLDLVTDAPDVLQKFIIRLMGRILGRARPSLSSRRVLPNLMQKFSPCGSRRRSRQRREDDRVSWE